MSNQPNPATGPGLPDRGAVGGRPPSPCSASIGPYQRKAAEIWEEVKRDEGRYVDLLEMCAVLMVNVADKSQSTDHEISGMVRRLMHDMRSNSRGQNGSCDGGAEPSEGAKV